VVCHFWLLTRTKRLIFTKTVSNLRAAFGDCDAGEAGCQATGWVNILNKKFQLLVDNVPSDQNDDD
jgi:hypothetical protein